MKILYFDCFSGISGDMTLGALIDCGVDAEDFKRELSKLHIDGYSLEITRKLKNNIMGTDVNVILHDEHHGHEHEHEHHHHSHGEHIHRNLEDIEHIIDESELNESVKSMSKKIFTKLANAEAKIHGKSVDEVHFHEVGAVDSIVDIVGTSICIDILGIDKFVGSPVNTGMGFVECQHGTIPVPGPAAVELLKGVPVFSSDIDTELVTPTGAAIISTLCEDYGPLPPMTIERAGYGSGKKDIDIPNMLRVIIGQNKKKDDDVCVIECNIDDMDSEFYEHVMEKLFCEGALDVYLTNIMMKKNRPAVKLSVIAKNDDADRLSSIIFEETSTIGVRKYSVERETLERKVITVETGFGDVHVKVAYRDGKPVNYAPEYEDIKKIAQKTGMPIKHIYMEAIKNI